MGIEIAPAGTDDRDAVIALWRQVGLTRPWNDPASDFDLALSFSGSTILLAHDCTKLVGAIMVGFDGHRGWVYYLACEPSHRREGIGRIMMDAAEAWLVEQGAPKIQLMVRTDNADAIGFYKAIGYEPQDVVTIGRRLDAES